MKILDLHKAEAKRAVEEGRAVKIDRSTYFGNPFRVGLRENARDRLECVRKFHRWFHRPEQAVFREYVWRSLRGKTLACWCRRGEACHGRVFVLYLEWREKAEASLTAEET